MSAAYNVAVDPWFSVLANIFERKEKKIIEIRWVVNINIAEMLRILNLNKETNKQTKWNKIRCLIGDVTIKRTIKRTKTKMNRWLNKRKWINLCRSVGGDRQRGGGGGTYTKNMLGKWILLWFWDAYDCNTNYCIDIFDVFNFFVVVIVLY